jgi:hypothetical protein
MQGRKNGIVAGKSTLSRKRLRAHPGALYSLSLSLRPGTSVSRVLEQPARRGGGAAVPAKPAAWRSLLAAGNLAALRGSRVAGTAFCGHIALAHLKRR